jgi:CHASE3 domain sensor protein
MSDQPPGQSRIRQLVGFLVFVPFVCLLIVAVLSYQTSRTLSESVDWVARTLEVKRNLSQLLSRVIDTETSQRGYLLTEKETQLEPYRIALQQLPRIQMELRQRTAENLHAQTQLDKLELLIAAKLKEVTVTIGLLQTGKITEALKTMQVENGNSLMDQIRAIVRRMQNEEDRLLALREETARVQAQLDQTLSQTTVILDALLILLLLHMIVRLQKMRNLVTVCAWTKAVRHEGQWITFEEYLKTRFNVDVSHGLSESARAQLQREVEAELPKKSE